MNEHMLREFLVAQRLLDEEGDDTAFNEWCALVDGTPEYKLWLGMARAWRDRFAQGYELGYAAGRKDGLCEGRELGAGQESTLGHLLLDLTSARPS